MDAASSPPGPRKAGLLARANRELEVLRWLLRMAEARRLLTARQVRFACVGLEEGGRMLPGWVPQASGRAALPAAAEVANNALGRNQRSRCATFRKMSKQTEKQRAVDAVATLPDNATLDDAIERLCFLAKVEEGLRQSEAGEFVDHEEVEKQFLA